MRNKGYYRREVTLEWELVREVKLPQGPAYVLYWIAVGCETDPGGGDGWNEPKYGPSASVFDNQVVTATVGLDGENDEERIKVYNGALIGPIEPGLVRPGFPIDLSDAERQNIEERALEKAWVEPDPDDEWERRMDR